LIYAPPVHMIKLNREREITTYVWVGIRTTTGEGMGLRKRDWQDGRTVRMPRKGITGHDEWVITEALATALIALEQLPPKHQPGTHMDDIRKLASSSYVDLVEIPAR
jgi:hypothetical protein